MCGASPFGLRKKIVPTIEEDEAQAMILIKKNLERASIKMPSKKNLIGSRVSFAVAKALPVAKDPIQ